MTLEKINSWKEIADKAGFFLCIPKIPEKNKTNLPLGIYNICEINYETGRFLLWNYPPHKEYQLQDFEAIYRITIDEFIYNQIIEILDNIVKKNGFSFDENKVFVKSSDNPNQPD